MRLSARALVYLGLSVGVVWAAEGGAQPAEQQAQPTPPPAAQQQQQQQAPPAASEEPGDQRPFIKWDEKLEGVTHDFPLFKSKFRQFHFKDDRRPGEVFEILDVNSDGTVSTEELAGLKSWVIDTGVRVPRDEL